MAIRKVLDIIWVHPDHLQPICKVPENFRAQSRAPQRGTRDWSSGPAVPGRLLPSLLPSALPAFCLSISTPTGAPATSSPCIYAGESLLPPRGLPCCSRLSHTHTHSHTRSGPVIFNVINFRVSLLHSAITCASVTTALSLPDGPGHLRSANDSGRERRGRRERKGQRHPRTQRDGRDSDAASGERALQPLRAPVPPGPGTASGQGGACLGQSQVWATWHPPPSLASLCPGVPPPADPSHRQTAWGCVWRSGGRTPNQGKLT